LPLLKETAFSRISLRLRLTMSFILVVLITAFLSLLLGYQLIFTNIIGQAYTTVRSDMNTTQYIYNERINVIRLFMEHISNLDYIKEAILTRDRTLLVKKLTETRTELSLDILNLTDADGKVIVRARNPEAYGDSVADDRFIRRMPQEKKTISGTDLMRREELKREGADLADQARIELVATARARKPDRVAEERGLVLKAAAPVFHRGKLIGILYGARLLNNDFEFVDRIKSLVFQGEQFEGRDIGTATIFLDDIRVSTNVRLPDGSRAVGTLLSDEVHEMVVGRGKEWLDKAFVVNNWYISAYNPIFDIDDQVIGILYVGVLEDTFSALKWKTAFSYVLVILLSGIIGLLFSLYFTRNIVAPYRTLTDASKEIAAGNYSTRVEGEFDGEVSAVASAFNKMVDAIKERDEAIKARAEKQIGQSEKLASLGRLASGIAHEINNPLTGILTYSSMLLEDFKGTEFEEDIQTIIDETMRCRKIVRGVLDFARETSLERELVNLNRILEDTLAILERHVHFHNVRILKQLGPDIPDQMLDINQIKSVINNLAVNAADAMPQGGVLEVSTSYNPLTQMVKMEFSDNGIGIPRENLERIFDPFFTTKEVGKGTGLGMAVTYGIVKRHGGTITVDSRVGKGTRIRVTLPKETPQGRRVPFLSTSDDEIGGEAGENV